MTDLAKTIAPKSDQLNADDLIAGPRTILIRDVRGVDGDQPVAVFFEGDEGKPWKPCKSMRRVLVHAWGSDGRTYAGRRVTIYCDQNVQFGGIKVGGIRISHLSHIERELEMALTATRAKRVPYRVKPLRAEVVQKPHGRQATPPPADLSSDLEGGVGAGSGEQPWDHIAWAQAQQDNADAFDTEAALVEWWGELSKGPDWKALVAAGEGEALALKAHVIRRKKALADQ